MKNYNKIIKSVCLSVVLLFATSCNNFLDITPEDQLVLENYYTSEEAINNNTASLYTVSTWVDFSMLFMWQANDELAGDLYYTNGDEGQFYLMTLQNGNTTLTQGWNGLYRVVSFCNNIINNMPDAAQKNGVDEKYINRGLAEARCIRAMAYFLLTEYWQDVPIIVDNNMSVYDIVRHKQSSVYEFIRRDLEFAKDNLPEKPFETGRCSKYTAIGLLAKLHLTMASHLSDASSSANFTKAKEYAQEVINNSGFSLYSDLKTMFYPVANNSEESLLAIQAICNGWGTGNGLNQAYARSSAVNLIDGWGGWKGPTLSLQEAFNEEPADARRPITYMRNGDHYDNLGGGSYTYVNVNSVEQVNPMLAHLRKYVIGSNKDCDNKAGSNQDAGNNLYLLRLTDVYMCYIEACIGSGTSTSDALALDVFKKVRNRAKLTTTNTSITYDELIKERRKEFALESVNYFDIRRMAYRNTTKALQYLNDMKRWRQYSTNPRNGTTETDQNASNIWHGGFTVEKPDTDNGIIGSVFFYDDSSIEVKVTENNLVLPIPAETITKTPKILQDPVDYQF